MAVNGAILLEPSGSSSTAMTSGSKSHFQEAFAKIDGMRKNGSLLCDVTIVFGDGNHIKVGLFCSFAVLLSVRQCMRLTTSDSHDS